MSKQDWLDYFEAVNGRSASAEEIAQALAAGEFQEEVVVPETHKPQNLSQHQLHLWKNQLQLHKPQSLLQRHSSRVHQLHL